MYQDSVLAAAGSTGNNTHSSVHVGGEYKAIAFVMNVTAIGATPTITYKYQGSADGTNWFDVFYVTDATDTASAGTRVMTTVSQQIAFLANPVARRYKYFRLVTSANTNVTYNAALYRIGAH